MAKKRRRARAQPLPLRVTPRDGWGIALEVDGVTQSVSAGPAPTDATDATDAADAADEEPQAGPGGGYWGLLLPPGRPQRALLLGLGGGTVAHLLARRNPGAQMTAIEVDARVIALAQAEFGVAALPQLTIVQADAFTWVAERVATLGAATAERYDLICLDLFVGGRLATGALATPFLRQLAALLTPAGTLTMNLLVTARTPDHLLRITRVFRIVRRLRLRGNLVVHATPLEPLEWRDAREEFADGSG